VRRRGFLGVLLSLPVIGTAAGRALGDAPAGSAAAAGGNGAVGVSESMAGTLWSYMDHASTWESRPRVSHRFSSPRRQAGQAPHETIGKTT
jgi:hypothetical protein